MEYRSTSETARSARNLWSVVSGMGLLTILFVFAFTGPGCSNGNNNNPDGGTKDGGTIKETESNKLTIKRKWTHRVIAGVSMGGGMASYIGMNNPDKFDFIGSLGAPNNLTYLLDYIYRSMLSGFCDIEKLEAAAKAGDLNKASSYCVSSDLKGRWPFEFTSHFNEWHYDDAGGNWNRTAILRVLQDLILAFGNPGCENPKSTYWPLPDFPMDYHKQSNVCKTPLRFKGIKHWKYNPEGKYDLITFCDGNTERSGKYYPDKPAGHTWPAQIILAVDINGNGKRDYGEPVIATPHEPFEDVGIDGCKDDREDGKGGCVAEGQTGAGGEDPNGDNYDPIKNPKGTEGNMEYDDKEPFNDNGIDGVAGTKDKGEGDGKWTMTSGLEYIYSRDPFKITKTIKREQLDRVNIYIDGGIRDLFNFHVGALHWYAALKNRYDNPNRVQMFEKFISLMPKGSENFNYQDIDWSTKGQHVYVQYGDPKATPKQIADGDGDHVHGAKIIWRVQAFFGFVTHHMPNPDLEEEELDTSAGEGVAKHYTYDSKALGRKHMYTVVVPPGFHQYPDKRYPVVYFGHGYGMSGPDMGQIFSLLMPDMKNGKAAKFILVAVHGACEQWLPVEGKSSFKRTKFEYCHKGTFYVDGKGINNNGPAMEKAFFEVVDEVEKKFKGRIRQPEETQYTIPVAQ